MKRATLILAALALGVVGCTTVTLNPLSHELDYHFTPAPDVGASVDKTIAVVPFEDGRMYDGNNQTVSTSLLWNALPLVLYTTGHVSHPEVVYNTTAWGMDETVKAAGSMADALPMLLADYLHRSRRFSVAKFVHYAEVKGSHDFDYVLRGTLVQSNVKARRYSWFLGPAAPVTYLLGAPMVHYSADLVVEWQLYDAGGNPVGAKQMATLDAPLTRTRALYYGMWADNKTVPLGLYVAAIRQVNAKIADDLSELVRSQ